MKPATRTIIIVSMCCLPSVAGAVVAGAESVNTTRGDQMLAAYFRTETQKLAEKCLADVKSWDDWAARRDELRRQSREMLGLEPLPERTPLGAVVTGKIERDAF